MKTEIINNIKICEESIDSLKKVSPDMGIVMIGEAGLGGGLRLLSEKRDVLEKRFNPTFLRVLDDKYDEIQRIHSDIKGVEKIEGSIIYQVPETGVLGGLWEIAKGAQVGFQVQLKAIPIRQEIIEICEFFRINPYRLESEGCKLVLTKNPEAVVKIMEQSGHVAVIIGRTTNTKEKLLCNGEDIRHIERPTKNEIDKAL